MDQETRTLTAEIIEDVTDIHTKYVMNVLKLLHIQIHSGE